MAKKEAGPGLRKARVLHEVSIDGIVHRSGDLILIDEAKAKAYGELGAFDFEPAAVAYCENELELTARDHAAEVAKLDPPADKPD